MTRRCHVVALLLIIACFASLAYAAELPPERPITAAEREHWAYRPVAAQPVPNSQDPRDAAHPVDGFLRAARQRLGIQPMPLVGRTTLLRRVCFDLTGLPPTVEMAAEFLQDGSPDAYEKLVERLLASPAYGERWAQHWLDLARFAETDGFEHDLPRPHAWRYRDWVIDALNRDMPFDEFLSLQIAGDVLRPGDPDAAIATGFLLCGPDMPDLNLQDERRHVVLNEMTSTVGAVFLAMQFGCAQCHDHKFDPIRQQDFYRLRAYFESCDIFRDHPIPTQAQRAARQAAEAQADPRDQQRAGRRRELESLGKQRFAAKNPDVRPTREQQLAELSSDEREELAQLVEQLRSAIQLPELPMGRVVREGPPATARFFARGDFRQPVGVIERGVPRVLASNEELQASIPSISPRQELAHWLTQPDHPLTARVIVNRLWQWHFGMALAPSASDFGTMGGEPTQPALLDWLATRLVRDGWSLKAMHRLLVTSEAYRLASAPYDADWSTETTQAAQIAWHQAKTIDPDNHTWWRRRRLRLEGEALRDAMLAVSDRLSTRRGGPGVRPPLPAEVTQTLLKDQWTVTGDEEDHRRRSIYLFVRRNLRYPLFEVFDRPDTNASCALRHESTTATQSLTLLNARFSLDVARALAGLARQSGPELGEQIKTLYARTLSRPATADELQAAREFLDRQSAALRASGRTSDQLALPVSMEANADPFVAAALVDVCLVLLNTNEFIYID